MVISRRNSGHLFVTIAAALAAAGIGCETTSHIDETFGLATKTYKEKMIANPEAGTTPDDGVIEIEGTTVEQSLKRYRTKQTRTPTTTALPRSILTQGVSSSR